MVGLGLVAVLPLLWPAAGAASERLAPLLALLFLLASVGLWSGLGRRSFLVAGVLVMALYGLTAWTRFAFPAVHDLAIVAVVVAFIIYGLAGFNLVFVLEEVVYDLHLAFHPRHRAWSFMPLVAVAALAIGLPLLAAGPGPALPATAIVALVATLVLGAFWFVRAFNRVHEGPVLRELHLFVVGGIAAAALVDGVQLMEEASGLLSSLVAYLALLTTWLYVSYTTLQRTHFLLRGRNVLPWMSILMAASFAVVWHAQLLFEVGGSSSLRFILDERVAFMAAGAWIGIAFFGLRSMWRLLRFLRDETVLGARARILSGRLARLTEAFFNTEERLGRAALRLFTEVEAALPGHAPRVEWEIDAQTGVVRRIGAHEEE